MKKDQNTLLEEFIKSFGKLEPDPLSPELLCYNARDFRGFCTRGRELSSKMTVPYWGIVWPGGRGMARYILDNKKFFRKKRVLDIGTGSGITAAAAAKAGARVTGIDIDPSAVALAQITSESNNVKCNFMQCGIQDISVDLLNSFDIILAADIFNDRDFAGAAVKLIRGSLVNGLHNYLSDSGRSHKPVSGAEDLARMTVPVFREIEGVRERHVTIFKLI